MTVISHRRPVILFLLLILTHVFLLSVQVRTQEGQLLLRSWTLMAISPLAAGLNSLINGAAYAVDRYALLTRVEQENEKLREENAGLRVEVARLRGLGAMLLRGQDFLLLKQQYNFDTVMAGVIWRSPPYYSHRLLINAGRLHGVKKDAGIITSVGIVGRVFATTPFSAEVEAITNVGAAAGVTIGGTGLQGIVQGNGSEILNLNFIPNFEEVKAGDVVYTSGTDKIYPKGLPVGVVTKSTKGATYREILIRPFVDFLRLEEVMVVKMG